jgi:hypothetical protein
MRIPGADGSGWNHPHRAHFVCGHPARLTAVVHMKRTNASSPEGKRASERSTHPLLFFLCVLMLVSWLFATYILITYDRLDIDKLPTNRGQYGMRSR